MSIDLATAYTYCRNVARNEAKNFYYAFVALPKHKSDAMCAIYAFMRKADDLSDDESISIADRRVMMHEWLEAWRNARAGAPTSDPVFIALNDTQQRFGIADELLEQLVSGTTLDLLETKDGVTRVTMPNGAPAEAYETFDDLYRYCYLVASVVGLVCIRVFGYTNPQAEIYAEHTGIAFQLTNILRDVREDAERGRIYLPLDDMQAAGTSLEQLAKATAWDKSAAREALPLLQHEIARAEEFYRASDKLIPLLDRDSRAAMEVLVTIYHQLLKKIAADPTAVFNQRVSVPTSRKLAILFKGMAKSMLNRVGA